MTECIIDAELFKKISSDSKHELLIDLVQIKHENGDFNCYDILECCCFSDLLKAIQRNRCKLGANTDIIEIYANIIKKCPNEIIQRYSNIYSNEDLFIFINDDLDHNIKENFNDTSLESKIPFISAAHFLRYKTIVSTKDDANLNYKECSDKLSLVRVECKDVCSAKDEIILR